MDEVRKDSRLDAELTEVLARHHEWLVQLPGLSDWEVAEGAVALALTSWIDEYSSEFSDTPAEDQLTEIIDVAGCWERILRLFEIYCRPALDAAHAGKSASMNGFTAAIYSTIEELAKDNSADAAESLTAIRQQFRRYEDGDGVRHCVMVGAILKQQNAAIEAFVKEFDSVRQAMAKRYRTSLGDEEVADLWQTFLIKMIWGRLA